MYFVYIIESKILQKRYIGFTKNIKNRLLLHKIGKTKTTSKTKDWKLIYFEMYLNKKDALGREKFLKSGSGYRYIKRQLRNYLDCKK